ncbi:MAG TPA: hypothetical protein VFU98_00265, partial [Microlunatus sp.]|nr:hypothetical protein [Microlunatus sp.]
MTENQSAGADTLDKLHQALDKALDAWNSGDAVGALHLLRSAPVPDEMPEFKPLDGGGRIGFSYPAGVLIRRAAEAWLSLMMGQWGDSPRHSPDSDSPHGYLTMYESLSPQLPERDELLRVWMDRLRVAVASDHARWPRMAAWALDMYTHGQDIEWAGTQLEALGNLAVAMSNLGYQETADALYRKLLDSDHLDQVSRAGFAVRYGSHRWKRGDKAEAERLYSEAVTVLEAIPDLHLHGRHDHVRALQRRSDCLRERGARDEALRDVDAAFRILDQARPLGTYQAVRSVDAAVVDDIESLLHQLSQLELTDEEAPVALGALCRLANSSAAAAARAVTAGPSNAVLGVKPEEAAIEARGRLARRWSAVTDSDIESLLTSPTPVLVTAITCIWQHGARGISIVTGAGSPPKVHHWRLDNTTQPANGFNVLTDLLAPPPGSAVRPNDPWSLPWHAESLRHIAEVMVPVDELSTRLHDSSRTELRIVPIGRMWRFPYTAVPIDDTPLGTLAPVVLTTGPSANTPAPTFRRWAGHFDLSLPNAVAELSNTIASTQAADLDLSLFSTRAELADITSVSHLVFAGHGVLGRGQQQLKLASGERCTSPDLSVLAPGASVVLNACWSGTVLDDIGADPADLVLSLIGEGAHSVLGTIGPVADT